MAVAFDALQDVGRVAALKRLDDPPRTGGVHLPGGQRDLVEEPPVVGHHQQTAGIAGPASPEVRGQPGDALDIEVVGRFVEDDHVPVAHQQLSELDAAALAAGERAHRRLPVDIGDQSTDDISDPCVAGPLVFSGIADQYRCHRGVRVEAVGLVQGSDRQPAAACHPSGVGLETADEHGQQAGFALPVASDEADSVAVVDAHGHGVEDHLRRILEMEGLSAQQMCHRR